MKNRLQDATVLLRLALAATFLSAVLSRLGLWGDTASSWEKFVEYTAAVNSFAPVSIIPFLAVAATVLEIILSVLLIIGYKTQLAAWGACILTLMFALAMTYSFGIKEPLNYSVFVDCAAAFLLANVAPYKWSMDEYLQRSKSMNQK
jgi:putative oxidoreductase